MPPRRDETEFARAALELATARAQVIADVEGELITLALAIAEALVEREVERDPLLHKRLALTALAVVQGAETATLRCAPESYDAVVGAFGADEIDVGGTRARVLRDETLVGLGVMVDAGATRVDGTLRERLHDAWRAIEVERKRDEGEEPK
jgi:flagellar biosynthesis/type III secretory pathway protein FliH